MIIDERNPVELIVEKPPKLPELDLTQFTARESEISVNGKESTKSLHSLKCPENRKVPENQRVTYIPQKELQTSHRKEIDRQISMLSI